MSDPLATVSASLPRRMFGLATLLCLGGVVIYIAMARPPEVLGWQVFLLIMGGAALWLAEKLRRATLGGIVLTAEGLFDTEGRELARLDQIKGVERGMFAMKPSNGFTVLLTEKPGNAWAPGLWWRLGRRLGVGGVTAAGQCKGMAEILTALVADRDRSS